MSSHFDALQARYPEFVYVGYAYEWENEALIMHFNFALGEHRFTPQVKIYGLDKTSSNLDVYVFHVGLAEMLTYWKLACSPQINIVAGYLDAQQIKFWQKLIFHGMGEFFCVNDIVPFAPEIKVQGTRIKGQEVQSLQSTTHNLPKVLVPIGGGKDSIVTLELLQAARFPLALFTIGADQATDDVINVFRQKYGKTREIHVEREIDSQLLALNERGFFNGHTPFSSVVAFLSLLAASTAQIKYIALSNERSANEATGQYHGIEVNHQYSKTYEFESDFRAYVAHTFTNAPNYFSLLRPLYELQIMHIFTKYPEYFHVFRSCNVGKKKNIWCGACAKCLFVAIMLSAFLPKVAIQEIFGKDILDDGALEPILKQLLGETAMKAFECVGTREETLIAREMAKGQINSDATALLHSFDSNNYLPDSFKSLIYANISA